MVINPILKYHRRSIRLPRYDYSQAGAYFVTICCKNRAWAFGEVVDGTMVLNGCGEIARECWLQIPRHFPNAVLCEFVVMPNHVHGIVVLDGGGDAGAKNAVGSVGSVGTYSGATNPVWALHATPIRNTPQRMASISPKPGTLSVIVRSYKSAVSKHAHQSGFDFAWQRNYYEHIIRTEADYRRIAEYIVNNPARWTADSWYVDKILAAKAADAKVDTSETEAEVDRLVYGLYGLTEGEIAVVEGER